MSLQGVAIVERFVRRWSKGRAPGSEARPKREDGGAEARLARWIQYGCEPAGLANRPA
jgi:hypothetical protein